MSRSQSLSSPTAIRHADPSLPENPQWYRDAVIYQLHVRGFFDSNEDGVGDFEGLTQKLDYIQSLGVSAVWLQPFYPSPLRDDGYDIAHYQGIHPSYGTRRDFARFMSEAHRRGLRVVTELVINHTSDQHPWFQAARRARPGTSKRNFYVWSDTPDKYAGVPIVFKDAERSNWTWDPVAGAYYWHRFFYHQPDLNFDNPLVKKAVLKVMRFWLDLGVDGMRLDAVPYLVEREGTQCANLPETHAILKDIRRELDAHYADRMLLAEANQWPSDVRAYFGDGDECHMAFHFPLMPRLYMALRQEDRHPLSEILWQMPDIPDVCQWALFLRNHDELTLEMVSDEERDYLYQTYAADPQMRLNVGIRRRLAPLMDNSRPRLELMNGLLLSLPGTPVLYYGDELGMGDNVYLGDRNGVRTPMQWNADRNGGFSRADPARLYAPPIMDSVYGYQAVNVEAQERSPHSLLNWMRRLIALRQRYPIFGRGTMELLRPTNRHIFAFLRRLPGADPVLVVANLSRTVQAVSMDLSRVSGLVPIEMTGGVDLPRITDAPYFLTLGPHGFFWLLLQRDAPPPLDGRLPTIVAEPDPERVPLLVGPEWHTLLDGSIRHLLERRYLPGFLRRQPWFARSPRALMRVEIADWGLLAGGDEPALLTLVDAHFDDGGVVRYALPLLATPEARAAEIIRESPQAIVAHLAGAKRGILHDRLDGPAGRALVSDVMHARHMTLRHGTLHASQLPDFPQLGLPGRIEELASEPFDFERWHSSAAFGERVVLKVLRRMWDGPSPHVQFARALKSPDSAFTRVPAAGGLVEYRRPDGTSEPIAIVESYIPHQSDGWRQIVGDLSRFLESPAIVEAPPASPPVSTLWTHEEPDIASNPSSSSLQLARAIGQRAAQMHVALARLAPAIAAADTAPVEPMAFAEAIRASVIDRWERAAQALLPVLGGDSAVAALAQQLLDHDAAVRTLIGETAPRIAAAVPAIPIHGRFDLRRVLVFEGDVTIIDAASDPAIAPADRLRPRDPFADLGRMLWSFAVAARVALDTRRASAPPPHDKLASWARRWMTWTSASFLAGYRAAAGGDTSVLPEDATSIQHAIWLRWLESAFRDVESCAAQSPKWLALSLESVLDALDETSTDSRV
jgi:maltose alpha-D-glucosyltransferase/alpha-amylase